MEQPDSRINFQFLFHVLPDPIVIIDRAGTIVDINLTAKDIFAPICVGEKIESLFVDKKKIKESILELLQYHRVIVDKAIIRTNKSSVQPFEFKVTILSESNEIFVVIFNHLYLKNELIKLEIEQIFSTELHTLKPYLNKSGKELVENKILTNKLSTVFESELKQLNPSNFTNSESIEIIRLKFPHFTINEINIAYFMSLGASINQIATITEKNANTIRVMVHRMLSKTSFSNTADFTNFLKSIIQQ